MRLPLAFLLILCVPAAFAQVPSEHRSYLIFQYGEAGFDDEPAYFTNLLASDFGISGSFDEVFFRYNDEVFKVTDGYLLTDHFGVEGSFTFLDDSRVVVTRSADGGSQSDDAWRMDMRQYGLDFHVFGNLHLFKGLTGQAKLGGLIFRNEIDLLGATTGPSKDDGGSLSLGLSLRYDFGSGLMASVDWQQTDFGGIDTSLTTIGLGFHY